MIFIIITLIILLYLSRKYFTNYLSSINIGIKVLCVWLVLGLILKYFLSEPPQRKYTDVEMAQTWINDNPELKAKMKILDDGSVRIILKKRKYLHLKDGVLTNGK